MAERIAELEQRIRAVHPETITPAHFGRLRVAHLQLLRALRVQTEATAEFVRLVAEVIENDGRPRSCHQGPHGAAEGQA